MLYEEHPLAGRSVWRGVQPPKNLWVLQDKNSQLDTQGNCILKAGKETRENVSFFNPCTLSFLKVHILFDTILFIPFPELILRQMSEQYNGI